MQRRVDVYLGEYAEVKFGMARIMQGTHRFSLNVTDTTTLQTIAASIYQYIQDNNLVGYSTYIIRLRGNIIHTGFTPPVAPGARIPDPNVSIFVPNDLYVPEFSRFTVGDLPRLIPGFDLNSPIKASAGNKVDVGLSEYI